MVKCGASSPQSAMKVTCSRRVGRGAGSVVAKARVQTGQVQFLIKQVIERVLEGTGEQLLGQNNGEKPGTGIDSLVAGHLNIVSPEILMHRCCSAFMTGAISRDAFSTTSLGITSALSAHHEDGSHYGNSVSMRGISGQAQGVP